MHGSQYYCWELFDSLHNTLNGSVYCDIVAPWVESHPGEREWLRAFASRHGEPIPPADDEDLWRLYAFSRVNEILLLGFQHGRADGSDWPGPKISLDEHKRFAESIGLTVANPEVFSPFYHEIVEVDESSDEDQPLEYASTVWPCLMLGNMVFSRAGVRVAGGAKWISKEVAESSTLYWALRRKNRPFQDLSHGWGHNSQWRTSFRRDYRIGDEFHYNVDGKHDIAGPKSTTYDRVGLTREERNRVAHQSLFYQDN
jgi:hypothetical protein